MNPGTIADIAFELFSALKKQKMIQPLTDRYPDIDINDAYQISKKFLSHREIEGEKVIGKKIGVTSIVVQEMLGVPLLGAIPEDPNVIIATNRGEPLVLKKKLTLSGIAFENSARRLIGKQDYMIDLASPYKGVFQRIQEFFLGSDLESL